MHLNLFTSYTTGEKLATETFSAGKKNCDVYSWNSLMSYDEKHQFRQI